MILGLIRGITDRLRRIKVPADTGAHMLLLLFIVVLSVDYIQQEDKSDSDNVLIIFMTVVLMVFARLLFRVFEREEREGKPRYRVVKKRWSGKWSVNNWWDTQELEKFDTEEEAYLYIAQRVVSGLVDYSFFENSPIEILKKKDTYVVNKSTLEGGLNIIGEYKSPTQACSRVQQEYIRDYEESLRPSDAIEIAEAHFDRFNQLHEKAEQQRQIADTTGQGYQEVLETIQEAVQLTKEWLWAFETDIWDLRVVTEEMYKWLHMLERIKAWHEYWERNILSPNQSDDCLWEWSCLLDSSEYNRKHADELIREHINLCLII